LKENVPNFIEPNVWPPNSLYLNPLDYTQFPGALQQLVYRQRIQDIEHLNEVLHICLEMISQDLIDGAVNWSKRITVVIQAQGGHIEHRLK